MDFPPGRESRGNITHIFVSSLYCLFVCLLLVSFSLNEFPQVLQYQEHNVMGPREGVVPSALAKTPL